MSTSIADFEVVDYPKAKMEWGILPHVLDGPIDYEALALRPDILEVIYPIASEWKRRAQHPGYAYIPDESPDRNQLAFHKSQKIIRCGFGGNGSGKSYAGAWEIKWALEGSHPWRPNKTPCSIYLISASYQNHMEGMYRHLMREDPILFEWEIAKYGPMVDEFPIHKWIELKNGSRLTILTSSGGEAARRRFASAQLDGVAIDEEIIDRQWEEIKMRVTQKGGWVIITSTLVESFPWLCKLESKGDSGDKDVGLWRFNSKRAAECGHLERKQFIMAFGDMSDEEKEVRMLGHSRKRHGLVYSEFNSQDHVCEPFEIPKTWTRYMAVDPGWHTCAVVWLAVSPEGRFYFYRCLYEHHKNHRDIAALIRKAEGWEHAGTVVLSTEGEPETASQPRGSPVQPIAGLQEIYFEKDLWKETPDTEQIEARLIDPSSFGSTTEGTPKIGTLFNLYHDLPMMPAQNEVSVGIESCKGGLAVSKLKDPPQARFQFFSTTMQPFFEEIQNYRWPKERATTVDSRRLDRPVKRRDHAMDAWRYLVLHRPVYIPPHRRQEMLPEEYEWNHQKSEEWNLLKRTEFYELKERQSGVATEGGEHVGGLGSIY